MRKLANAVAGTRLPYLIDWRKELPLSGETSVVFRDEAFADDVAKINLTAILQQHGIAQVRSLQHGA